MLDVSSHAADRIQLALTAILLALSVVLGGGQGGLGDTFLQLLATGLIGFVLVRPKAGVSLASPSAATLLVLLVLSVPLAQLTWAGIGAERALWFLLPGVAIYLSTLGLSTQAQRVLLGVFLLLALLSLVLGLAQLADGRDSALRFYANTNRGDAVGFFANRNHLAALLLMAMPLSLAAVAYLFAERAAGKPIGILWPAAAFGMATVLILGIALTRSRAGMALGMLGLVLCLPMVMSLRRGRGIKRVFALLVAAALLLTVQFALFGILQRLQADPLGDQRWQIARITAEAARHAGPLGSGLGTFRDVFQSLDTEAPGSAIVNHAHDDYLELWLEAGWVFIVALAGTVVVLAWRSVRVWRSREPVRAIWAKAASVSVLLLLLHSLVDYPLRTSANLAVAGLFLGVLMRRDRRSGLISG